MTLRAAVRTGVYAARTNLLPGLLLQAVMLCFIAAYVWHDGTRSFLALVADLREEAGYGFAAVSYLLTGAVLPEALRVVFFQRGRVTRHNVWMAATAAPLFIVMGMVVDFFYRCQNGWFGDGNDFGTVAVKVLVDQLVYSPFVSNPVITGYLTLRSRGFRREGWRLVLTWDFVTSRMLPVQISAWAVWFPGVCFVYVMPPLLQIPVAVMIQCFWVLLLTTIHERSDRPHPQPQADPQQCAEEG